MPNAFKDTARFNAIAAKFAAYGFHHVLDHVPLLRGKRHAQPSPELLRKLFEDLGGAFPKLGQLLSLRPDLIPQAYSDALEGLQDNMRPFSGAEAERIIERELGTPLNTLFKTFDRTPIAAASIGQVHGARLKDGTTIVVKVQRPHIRDAIATDIDILEKLAAIAARRAPHGPVDPTRIVEEFKMYTAQELDYGNESKALLRFAQTRAAESIILPKAIEQYCTSRVLVMTRVHGVRITSLKNVPERRAAARALLHTQLQSVFLDGFFHADPHPGNVLWHEGKLVLLDFGIVGSLSDPTRETLGRVLISMLAKDMPELARGLHDLGFIPRGTGMNAFEADLAATLGSYYDRPLGDLRIGELFHVILDTARRNQVSVPPNFVLLMKTIVTTESTCARLDQQFRFTREARPFLRELIKARVEPRAIMDRFSSGARRWRRFLQAFPEHANRFLELASQGEETVGRLDTDLNLLTKEVHIVSGRLVMGILAGAFVIAGALVSHVGPMGPYAISIATLLCFAFAIVFIITIAISSIHEHHRR